ncbi:hypothetical protein PBAL39_09431 [Pedobacter sp. BAL39]|uniref:DUF4139 domain-containing protein n=1 Tax=Pedobacter sp. BAL39 TaxID=391596 RepID=UPI0001559BC0|nr:DUF4139 domain-containing protein [Pedobacter sp. BAL39]EDM37354.1 hypothetical protein PBAL39_09431 [Pedobacter sp. BAL39]
MKSIFILFLSLIGIQQIQAQLPPSFNAKLESVSIYSHGALLNHSAKVRLPSGTTEILLTAVANQLYDESLQINVPEGVTILSTSYVMDYLKNEKKSPAYLKVEDSLSVTAKVLSDIQNNIVVEENMLLMLDKNQTVGGTANGVNVAELIKVTEYYKRKQLELRASIYNLRQKEELLKMKISKMQQQLKELNSSPSDNTGQLLLQLVSVKPIEGDFKISYMAPGASWTPFYDLRAENAAAPLKIMYKANVVQSTGLDWKKVKLSLSTGNPNRSGSAPILSPWFLRYQQPQQLPNALEGKVAGISANRARAKAVPSDNDMVLNEVVISPSLNEHVNATQQTLSTVFDIDIPYDILSNGKPQLIALRELTHPVQYKYYSIPKADADVFLVGEISGYDQLDLLPGEASVIFENSYVGKTTIQPNTGSDTLQLSMGRDKKIIVKREKIAEQTGTKFIGANKKQTFNYEISIRNGKNETVSLYLRDQYPITTDKDVEVELLDSGSASVNPQTGILTWNLKLKPGATQKIKFSYAVKSPKDKVLANL